jgi:hypothetical protein
MSVKEGLVEAFPSNHRTVEPVKRPKWYHLWGKDISYVSVDAGHEPESETSSVDEGAVKNTDSVFESAEASEIYRPVEGFEGTHRFDATATWTPEEEKKLVRKVSFTNRMPD